MLMHEAEKSVLLNATSFLVFSDRILEQGNSIPLPFFQPTGNEAFKKVSVKHQISTRAQG